MGYVLGCFIAIVLIGIWHIYRKRNTGNYYPLIPTYIVPEPELPKLIFKRTIPSDAEADTLIETLQKLCSNCFTWHNHSVVICDFRRETRYDGFTDIRVEAIFRQFNCGGASDVLAEAVLKDFEVAIVCEGKTFSLTPEQLAVLNVVAM